MAVGGHWTVVDLEDLTFIGSSGLGTLVRAARRSAGSGNRLELTHPGDAFPTSARHGLGRRQIDPGGRLIAALERSSLAWDVVRISSARQEEKAARRA